MVSKIFWPCMRPGLMYVLEWVCKCTKSFFPNSNKCVTKSHVIELSSGVSQKRLSLGERSQFISFVSFLQMSFNWLCHLKMWATVFRGESKGVSQERVIISHTIHTVSRWPHDVCDAVWLPFVLCLANTLLKSSVPEKCSWVAFWVFSLLLSFLQKGSRFTYHFETGLRKQWPAQPPDSFSGASVLKDENTCRRVFLGFYWGWCYITESVSTLFVTVTY